MTDLELVLALYEAIDASPPLVWTHSAPDFVPLDSIPEPIHGNPTHPPGDPTL
jgi:hypothetical protein